MQISVLAAFMVDLIMYIHCNEHGAFVENGPPDEMMGLKRELKYIKRSNYIMKEQFHHLRNSFQDVKSQCGDCKAKNDLGQPPCILLLEANNSLMMNSVHMEQKMSDLSTQLAAILREQNLTHSRLIFMEEQVAQLIQLMSSFALGRCQSPPEVPNADIVFGCDVLNPVVTYKCKPDFKPCGLQTVSRCQASGEWTAVSGRCARFRWSNPVVKFYEHLPCQDQDVMHLIIKARPTKNSRMFFSLNGDGDGLLIVDCRFKYYWDVRQIVLNDKINGTFGREIRPRGFPFTVNESFIMEITRSNGTYKISVGKHTWNFPERGVGATPKKLFIQHDIRIEDIEIHI